MPAHNSTEGNVWSRGNSSWRGLFDTATIAWDFATNGQAKANAVGAGIAALAVEAGIGALLTAAGFGLTGLFAAHRNGTDQTSMSAGADNKFQGTTEIVDASGWYDNATNYRYTPQLAGKYFVFVQMAANFGTSGETPQALIYKNGSVHRRGLYFPTSTGIGPFYSSIPTLVTMNGTTDYLEAFCYLPVGTTTIAGSEQRSWWGAARWGA